MKLSPHQKKVLAVFTRKNVDVPIMAIFLLVYGRDAASRLTVREMQQKLAPTFANLNKKLKSAKIEPGDTKRTYRYTANRKV